MTDYTTFRHRKNISVEMSVIIFNYPISIKMLFYMLAGLVFTSDILSQSDSGYVHNVFDDSQKTDNDINFHHENYGLYHTSKHVFYWLYTRDNANGQLLNRSEPRMIESTTYNEENPITVIVHGWLGTTQEKDGVCSYNVKAFLKFGNYNLICVDWKQYSTDLSYAVAKARVPYIAKDIANMLTKVTCNLTIGYDTVHLIGHSLGAHIVGFVGKNLPNIPRITGLDPAKPMYEKSGPEDRLDETDAIFVDVMHTNAGKNGLNKSIGHMDFYPNGGEFQPGCKKTTTGSCSHVISYHYFAESICDKNAYVSHRCSSWNDYKANKCDYAYRNYMGEHVNITGDYGDYYLYVNSSTSVSQ